MEKQKEDKHRRKLTLLLLLIIILLSVTSCTAGYILGRIGNAELYAGKIIDIIKLSPREGTPVDAPSFHALDAQSGDTWEQSSLVGIFSGNPERGVFKVGNQTVIAPGAKGKYSFKLVNLESLDILYYLSLADSDLNVPKLPLRYRLLNGDTGEYFGGEEWVPVNRIIIEEGLLEAGNTHTLILEWKWEETDSSDTEIGTQKEIPLYVLEIVIIGNSISDGGR
jgi:hypothetical protein